MVWHYWATWKSYQLDRKTTSSSLCWGQTALSSGCDKKKSCLISAMKRFQCREIILARWERDKLKGKCTGNERQSSETAKSRLLPKHCTYLMQVLSGVCSAIFRSLEKYLKNTFQTTFEQEQCVACEGNRNITMIEEGKVGKRWGIEERNKRVREGLHGGCMHVWEWVTALDARTRARSHTLTFHTMWNNVSLLEKGMKEVCRWGEIWKVWVTALWGCR